MSKPELISEPSEITPEWLTRVLNDAGVNGVVNQLQGQSIGTGQVGENVRFTLSGEGDIPATVVGKFPSTDPTSRLTGVQQGTYIKEARFYEHLQSCVDIQTPKVFYLDLDQASHMFVLIMEDLAPGTQGNQLKGCNIEDATLAINQLAMLHGPMWGRTEHLFEEVIVDGNQHSGEHIKGLYDLVTAGFLDRYQSRLTPYETEIVRQVGECMPQYFAGYQGDLTLIHGDYRLDNMMFGGNYPLTVIDWQTLSFSCPLSDVAYFLGTSLTVSDRLSNEEGLVQQYFTQLSNYDVNLDWETCWQFYRHFAPSGLIMAVIASMIVEETERGNDMFMAMAKRSARMCKDLDTISIITE